MGGLCLSLCALVMGGLFDCLWVHFCLTKNECPSSPPPFFFTFVHLFSFFFEVLLLHSLFLLEMGVGVR